MIIIKALDLCVYKLAAYSKVKAVKKAEIHPHIRMRNFVSGFFRQLLDPRWKVLPPDVETQSPRRPRMAELGFFINSWHWVSAVLRIRNKRAAPAILRCGTTAAVLVEPTAQH